MGYVSEDGLHEGYLVPQFGDGQRGRGVTGGRIPADQVVIGDAQQDGDGNWVYPTRRAGEVTGWVVCCDCSTATSFGPVRTWVGPVFTRVPSTALENPSALRIFAVDEDVADVSDRGDVAAVTVDVWRSEHGFGIDALAEVESAATAAAAAKERLDAAVALARHSGASWADIGRAARMARQSAQERWRHVDGDGAAG